MINLLSIISPPIINQSYYTNQKINADRYSKQSDKYDASIVIVIIIIIAFKGIDIHHKYV